MGDFCETIGVLRAGQLAAKTKSAAELTTTETKAIAELTTANEKKANAAAESEKLHQGFEVVI